MSGRIFEPFSWKDAHYRICSDHSNEIFRKIRLLREELEEYIRRCPEFASSMEPLQLPEDAGTDPRRSVPEIAGRMYRASAAAGVGPMAAVAGTIAQMAAEHALRLGAAEAVVENGGDLYIHSAAPIMIGLYAGKNELSGRLAFSVPAENLPLAICSSSGTMGHSLSFGSCDLATVFSKEAGLADAAATLAGNIVSAEEDIEPALEKIMSIGGVLGVLLVKNERIGLAGEVPEIVGNADENLGLKISKDRRSNY